MVAGFATVYLVAIVAIARQVADPPHEVKGWPANGWLYVLVFSGVILAIHAL